VSHSSRTPRAKDWLERFVRPLGCGEDAVDVLLDNRMIDSGHEWRRTINAMLSECDAAVVLITPDSLVSPWVLKEATILRWRHDQNPSFMVIPLALDVTRQELKNTRLWDPLDLPEIQFLSGRGPEDAAASLKSRIASLGPLDPTPLELLVGDIAGLLTEASQQRLRIVLNDLHVHVPLELTDQQRRFAYAVARWILGQPPPSLDRMAAALVRLGRTFPGDRARGILELVAPMWVELDAASWFVRADWQRPDLRDLAIVCCRPTETLKEYVERAHQPDTAPKVWMLNGVSGGDEVDDITRELRAVLGPPLVRRFGRDWNDAKTDEYLSRTNNRVYVALPLPEDHEVIAGLQIRYPRVTFVFFVPTASGLPPPAIPGVGWVGPEIDPELEERVYVDRIDAMAKFLA
jgi:hypothetical protein